MIRQSSASPVASRTISLLRHRFVPGAAAAAALISMAGCATAPLSYINDGELLRPSVLYRYPVRVAAIDGESPTFRPVRIAPGDHLLQIDAPAIRGFSLAVQKVYPVTIAPCTRYYFAAQRRGPFERDWELVLENHYPVVGCDPAHELEKARVAGAPAKFVPGFSTIEVE